ncbi:hypothetical protein E3P78_02591 [Wallemia ichthyophaga]|nr:hypothetical protein E3P78_02591 [Wallemia ichthyophaga]
MDGFVTSAIRGNIVDVLSRSIDAKTGDVTTERLIGVEQAAPLWAIKLFNCSSTAFVIERLTVSPQLQRTTARSVNLSLSDYLKCDETITYTPHPSNPALATLFSQTAQFTSAGTLGWKMAEKKLEEHSVRRFSENAGRGREVHSSSIKASCTPRPFGTRNPIRHSSSM